MTAPECGTYRCSPDAFGTHQLADSCDATVLLELVGVALVVDLPRDCPRTRWRILLAGWSADPQTPLERGHIATIASGCTRTGRLPHVLASAATVVVRLAELRMAGYRLTADRYAWQLCHPDSRRSFYQRATRVRTRGLARAISRLQRIPDHPPPIPKVTVRDAIVNELTADLDHAHTAHLLALTLSFDRDQDVDSAQAIAQHAAEHLRNGALSTYHAIRAARDYPHDMLDPQPPPA